MLCLTCMRAEFEGKLRTARNKDPAFVICKAFQGDTDEDSNLFQLFKLRANDDASMHDWLKRHDKYLSHEIQNEMINGTVSATIAPRLKCYKNASRLNRYNFPTDNAIDFLCSNGILHHFTMTC